MKTILTIITIGLLACILSLSANPQDIFIYDRNGGKIYLTQIDSIVQIKFKDGVSDNERLAIARSVNYKADNIGISGERSVCIPVDKNNLPDYKKLNSNNLLVYANLSLQYFDGTIQIPTDKVLARIKDGYEIKEILSKLNIEYENFRRIGHNVNSYLVVLKNGKSVETANFLYESGYFEYVQPSFVRLNTSLNTHYTDQWALNNTGQNGGTAGIDINAPEAWEITEGCDNIVVAVLDQGVDLDHPDLAGNLLTGFDATDGSDGAEYGDCHGNYAHGTCCAGIIAAIDNSVGIKGIAPDCKIIPVRIMKTNHIQYDNDVIEGMNYAWEIAGADVISCSWKIDGSPIIDLDDEISYALAYGRGGLGCVVVFGTGNNNSSVVYPANSNPDIIAVGAMSPCGERTSPSSCDTEDDWGSNYGTQLDLVAPGVLIPTTDIQDTFGYNPNEFIHEERGGDLIDDDYNDQDYTICFSGTSAATPHVAGVAALILSINPELTQDEVRDVIESTCTKVGGYNYSTVAGRNNGTWNNQVGYGCVNAYKALKAVCPISGSPLVCSSGAEYTLNIPGVTAIEWNNGSYIYRASAQGSNPCIFNATGSGNTWIEATVTTDCGEITLPRKYIWAGPPSTSQFDILNPNTYDNTLVPGEFNQLVANDFAYQSWTTEWEWDCGGWYHIDLTETKFITQVNVPYSFSYKDIKVRLSNTCDHSDWYTERFYPDGGYFMLFTPNPTTGETTLSIESTFEDDFDKNTEWEFEVYSEAQLLKEKKPKLKGKNIVIQTNGWQEGVYAVRVKYKDEVLTGKLVVKK